MTILLMLLASGVLVSRGCELESGMECNGATLGTAHDLADVASCANYCATVDGADCCRMDQGENRSSGIRNCFAQAGTGMIRGNASSCVVPAGNSTMPPAMDTASTILVGLGALLPFLLCGAFCYWSGDDAKIACCGCLVFFTVVSWALVNGFLYLFMPMETCPQCKAVSLDHGGVSWCGWPHQLSGSGNLTLDCPIGCDKGYALVFENGSSAVCVEVRGCTEGYMLIKNGSTAVCVPLPGHATTGRGSPTPGQTDLPPGHCVADDPGYATDWKTHCNTTGVGDKCVATCSDQPYEVVYTCRKDLLWHSPQIDDAGGVCPPLPNCTVQGSFFWERTYKDKGCYTVTGSNSCWWDGPGTPGAGAGRGGIGILLFSFFFSSSMVSQPYALSASSANGEPSHNVMCPDDPRQTLEHPHLELSTRGACPMTETLMHGKLGLQRLLERWSRDGILLHNISYVVQSINFTRVTEETYFEGIAWLGDLLGDVVAPLQHHSVAFDIAPSALRDCTHISAMPHHLIIHWVTSGLIWEVSPLSVFLMRTFEVDGSFSPGWVSEFLDEGTSTDYGFLTSNCQHFASRMVRYVYQKCRAEGTPTCSEVDLTSKLPAMVDESWGLLTAVLLIIAIVVGAVVIKCRQWTGNARNVRDDLSAALL